MFLGEKVGAAMLVYRRQAGLRYAQLQKFCSQNSHGKLIRLGILDDIHLGAFKVLFLASGVKIKCGRISLSSSWLALGLYAAVGALFHLGGKV